MISALKRKWASEEDSRAKSKLLFASWDGIPWMVISTTVYAALYYAMLLALIWYHVEVYLHVGHYKATCSGK